MPVPAQRRPAGVQPRSTSPDRPHPRCGARRGLGGSPANPAPANAAGDKVVIVVGPVGSSTAELHLQRQDATRPRPARTAPRCIEIYSPNATWSKVKTAAQGANVFIYLGHGNGYPSPYGAFQQVHQGRARAERDVRQRQLQHQVLRRVLPRPLHPMAPNAVVLLNRLCYASGNSEWGAANPTKSTAIKRVDNYGAGFLRAGARAVFAEGIDDACYIDHQACS